MAPLDGKIGKFQFHSKPKHQTLLSLNPAYYKTDTSDTYLFKKK